MRPRLTHRAMMDLLEVRSMAQADAEAMDGECPSQTARATVLMRGCEWISKLAAAWAKEHGCDWPTEYKKAKDAAR